MVLARWIGEVSVGMSWNEQRIREEVDERVERLVAWLPWHREYFAELKEAWVRDRVAWRKWVEKRP